MQPITAVTPLTTVSIGTLGGQPYTQEFNTLVISGVQLTTLPAGWQISENGFVTPQEDYEATTGSNTNINTYSMGSSGNTERALGQLNGSAVNQLLYVGVPITNNTGSTINEVFISYIGEQWRYGGASTAGVPDRFDFQIADRRRAAHGHDHPQRDGLGERRPARLHVAHHHWHCRCARWQCRRQ